VYVIEFNTTRNWKYCIGEYFHVELIFGLGVNSGNRDADAVVLNTRTIIEYTDFYCSIQMIFIQKI